MRLAQVATSFLLYTLFTHAWPWPPSLREFRGVLSDSLIERRQDNNGDSKSSRSAAASSAASTAASKPAAKSSKPTAAASTVKETGTASSKKGQATGKTTGSPSPSSSRHPRPTSVNDQDGPGEIEMVTPARTTTTYFKIGDDVTLAWNYTNLQITPSAINVLASNTAGTWTLTANASVKETGSVVWKTSQDEGGSNPLLTDTYTLVVYDANHSVTDTPGPGELSPFMNFQFGMYVPQKALYTPLTDFICATCSAGMSDLDRTTMKFVLVMVGMTVLSFTYFVSDFLALI